MGLEFVKETSFGNNFVIVDETRHPVLPEEQKRKFAYLATNQSFGIGCDNFLVIQRCTPQVLDEINAYNHYWDGRPDTQGAEYIFRMFEPDGSEAFSCGNGLMCVANYLLNQHGVESARIMTEVPTAQPKTVSIGSQRDETASWANLGRPRRVCPSQAALDIRTRHDDDIDLIENIEINNFRKSDGAQFFSNRSSVAIRAYLVSTGEPHLVIFTDSGFSIPGLSDLIFPDERSGSVEKRRSTSSAFVEFIGSYFARVHKKHFPSGININFVRYRKETDTLEYRCFERGINRETLACGTGALACAFVAERLGLVRGRTITVLPHRCRWHDPDAVIRIRKSAEGWILFGRPILLCHGTFNSERLLPDRSMANGVRVSPMQNRPRLDAGLALSHSIPA